MRIIKRWCYLHNNYGVIPGRTFGELENDLKINLKNEWINTCGLDEIEDAEKIKEVCRNY